MIILSPAKINFFLAVENRRPDGYHDIVSLMCPVSIFDKVEMAFKGDSTKIRCDHPGVPEDETNIACRAAEIFFRKLGKRAGVEISIEKNIPVAAGLGGGSSNGAAVISSLNQYFHYPFSKEKLIKMGAEIGADLPFFIARGPNLARGIGEKLKPVNLLPYKVILINPGFTVSTSLIYKKLNLGLTKCKKKINRIPFEDKMIDPSDCLCNDLEIAACRIYPQIEKIKALLIELGARGSLMSGSGPTVFGIFPDESSAERAFSSIPIERGWKKIMADMLV